MTDQQRESVRGEVEDWDVYRMRDRADVVSVNDPKFIHEHGHKRHFNFEPTLIFDLGANVGTFSRYCSKLFPKARIIAIEPNEWNCEQFKADIPENVELIQAAIGNGPIYFTPDGAANSTGYCYLSAGLGYTKEQLSESRRIVDVPSIRLVELAKFIRPGDKTVMKLDIEGAENSIFGDAECVEFLKTIDYITAEMHFFAYTHNQVNEVRQLTESVLKSFEQTHDCRHYNNGLFFHATKR